MKRKHLLKINLATVAFCFFILQCTAQKKYNSISFSLSNNGEVEKLMTTYFKQYFFYFTTGAYYTNVHDNNIKFNLHYEHGKDSSAAWFVKAGLDISNRKYVYNEPRNYSTTTKETQQVYSFAAGRLWNLSFHRFTFSTGVELPVYYLTKFQAEIDEGDGYSYAHTSSSIDGGYSAGINSIISAKFNFSKHLFMRTDATVGLLYSKVGGNLSGIVTGNGGNIQTFESPDSNREDGTSISKPEFFIGAGFVF